MKDKENQNPEKEEKEIVKKTKNDFMVRLDDGLLNEVDLYMKDVKVYGSSRQRLVRELLINRVAEHKLRNTARNPRN